MSFPSINVIIIIIIIILIILILFFFVFRTLAQSQRLENCKLG